jgi:hypothetical protein
MSRRKSGTPYKALKTACPKFTEASRLRKNQFLKRLLFSVCCAV